MDSIPYADIVVLALIAGFILLRLRSVLGDKTGNENPKFFVRDEPKTATDDKVIHINDKITKPKPQVEDDVYMLSITNDAIAKTIADVKKIDPQFNATMFMDGAKMAFEMVFDAFNKGDKKTLEMLLEKNLYQTFAAEIDARASLDTVTETTLVSIKPREIVNASLTGNVARFEVKFDSEQVVLTKDKNGTIIGGNVSQTTLMDDAWVFERDVSSKNPNWKIIET